MKIFILILFFKAGYGGGLTSMEFNTLEDCDRAKREAIAAFDTGITTNMRGLCVEK